jgi:hypothetical protein
MPGFVEPAFSQFGVHSGTLENRRHDMFETFEQCRDHVLEHITVATPCRDMIVGICKWLYGIAIPPGSYGKIRAYPVDEPGARFCLTTPGLDHFFCIKYQKKCAELHFYRFRTPERPALPPYMQLVSDNENWIRVNGTNAAKLTIEEIKQHVRDAYRRRFGSSLPE